MRPYLDPRSGMLAREWDPIRQVWGALKLLPDPPLEPCIHCQALTGRTVIGGLCEKVKQPNEPEQSTEISPGSIGYGIHRSYWEVLHVCEACGARLVRLQAERVIANPEVYEHIREGMRVFLTRS